MATEGSTVILYGSFDDVFQVQLKAGEVVQNKYGVFKHSDIIGRRFGSKIHSSVVLKNSKNKLYVYLLKPTPGMITASLNHRTQIIVNLQSYLI